MLVLIRLHKVNVWKPEEWFLRLFLSWLLDFPIEIVTSFDSEVFFMEEEVVSCVVTLGFTPK